MSHKQESAKVLIQKAMDGILRGEDFHKSEKILLEAADQASGHAFHELGILYRGGYPQMGKDLEKSNYWLEKSLESGFEASITTDPMWFREKAQ